MEYFTTRSRKVHACYDIVINCKPNLSLTATAARINIHALHSSYLADMD